jgi:AcrR family transcriptional regulator
MGRHREFDPDKVLDAVLHVFWLHGFEGTSMSDLSLATKVAGPSLYSAFGNKREIFLQAVNRYERQVMGFVPEALDAPTAIEAAERLLRCYADAVTGSLTPPGCMSVNGTIARAKASESVRKELIHRIKQSEAALRRRFELAQEAGDLPSGYSPADVARFVTTVSHGLAVQANCGASLSELHLVIDLALKVIDGNLQSLSSGRL